MLDRREVRVEFVKAGGPGGQHRNKTESGVRLTHLPTGIVVRAVERRERTQNLAMAWVRLERRVAAASAPRKARKRSRPTKASVERRLTAKRRRARTKVERGGGE